jgi:lipoprotein-anchoring transpeptidase ErfK/SrfK
MRLRHVVFALAATLLLLVAAASPALAADDVTPPQGSVTLPPVVTSVVVTLTFDVSDAESGVTDVRASNDGQTWSEWAPLPAPAEGLSPQLPWTLPDGIGAKTVYAQVRNGAGLVADFSATTTLLLPADLTLVAKPAVVGFGRHAVLSGTLSLPGAPVTLLRRRASDADWVAVKSATTGAGGAFTFDPAPPVNTDYRVAFAGDETHAPAAADVRVLVRPRLTTDFPTGLSTVWLGDEVRLRGAVAPAHPGAEVLIERRQDGVWGPFATVTLRDDSTFVLPWKPDAFGFYHLRLRTAADADHAAVASAATRVIVNRPNPHRVPLFYRHYIVQVVHEYHTYYYEHGVMVRRFNVCFGRPGYPTPLGTFAIRWKLRSPGGALGVAAMFYYGSIAIHGTNEPWLLSRFPRNFSHGCTRMYNSQVLWLFERCPKGTPIRNVS